MENIISQSVQREIQRRVQHGIRLTIFQSECRDALEQERREREEQRMGIHQSSMPAPGYPDPPSQTQTSATSPNTSPMAAQVPGSSVTGQPSQTQTSATSPNTGPMAAQVPGSSVTGQPSATANNQETAVLPPAPSLNAGPQGPVDSTGTQVPASQEIQNSENELLPDGSESSGLLLEDDSSEENDSDMSTHASDRNKGAPGKRKKSTRTTKPKKKAKCGDGKVPKARTRQQQSFHRSINKTWSEITAGKKPIIRSYILASAKHLKYLQILHLMRHVSEQKNTRAFWDKFKKYQDKFTPELYNKFFTQLCAILFLEPSHGHFRVAFGLKTKELAQEPIQEVLKDNTGWKQFLATVPVNWKSDARRKSNVTSTNNPSAEVATAQGATENSQSHVTTTATDSVENTGTLHAAPSTVVNNSAPDVTTATYSAENTGILHAAPGTIVNNPAPVTGTGTVANTQVPVPGMERMSISNICEAQPAVAAVPSTLVDNLAPGVAGTIANTLAPLLGTDPISIADIRAAQTALNAALGAVVNNPIPGVATAPGTIASIRAPVPGIDPISIANIRAVQTARNAASGAVVNDPVPGIATAPGTIAGTGAPLPATVTPATAMGTIASTSPSTANTGTAQLAQDTITGAVANNQAQVTTVATGATADMTTGNSMNPPGPAAAGGQRCFSFNTFVTEVQAGRTNIDDVRLVARVLRRAYANNPQEIYPILHHLLRPFRQTRGD